MLSDGAPGLCSTDSHSSSEWSPQDLVLDLACGAGLESWYVGPHVKVPISSRSVGDKVKIQERVIGS